MKYEGLLDVHVLCSLFRACLSKYGIGSILKPLDAAVTKVSQLINSCMCHCEILQKIGLITE